MLPTILISLAIAAICGATVARSIHNRHHGRSGCSCGGSCGSCGCSGLCHAGQKESAASRGGD